MGVRKYLDLDVSAGLDESLQQHPVVAEGLGGLASRTGERLGEVRRGAHDAHALPAAARRGLDEQRETHALRFAAAAAPSACSSPS